jgi:lipoprotein NlpI
LKPALAWLAWFTGGLLAAGAGAQDYQAGKHPLLDLARELQSERKPRVHFNYNAQGTRAAEHALQQARPPRDEDCARSLGASVFAGLHVDLGEARKAKGDFAGAIAAYRRARACTPRDARVLASLADALFDARDIAAAREVVHEALAINPRAVNLTRVAANIDFVEERWADAVSRYRYVASSEPDRTRAAYAQLMFRLAQMRAGIASPEFVERRHTEGWPRPLMLYLEDQYSEDELVPQVRAGADEDSTVGVDERLCEALYYVGEAYWARGQPEIARDYFTAMVNIKVIEYVEHGLALAEIAKLRKR